MATPHITGLAAYIAGRESARSGSAMMSRITQLATTNALTGLSSGTPNRLPFNANPKG
jgi:subtilisin family serine protease